MGLAREARPVEILLVEDNDADVRLTVEALKDCDIAHHLSVVGDGDEAIRYLAKQDRFASSAVPDLILLDLNLPLRDGRDVLRHVKTDERLRRIPVIVLTSSRDVIDVSRAYQLNANCYVVKPVEFDRFSEVLKAIVAYWLTVAELPAR